MDSVEDIYNALLE
jgi:hypothetical protein